MKGKALLGLFVLLLTAAAVNPAALAGDPAVKARTAKNGSEVVQTTYPATPSTWNGSAITSREVQPLGYWEWEKRNYRFNPSAVPTVITRFKHIASISVSNSTPIDQPPTTVKIETSAQQGSDFSTNFELSMEAKNALVGGVGAKGGYATKETRVTNEAVGYQSQCIPRAYVGCSIDFWYKGRAANGLFQYDLYHYGEYYDTVSDYNASAKVYRESLEVQADIN